MRKTKKNFKRKINPEKSNKMIYAVLFGLVIIFAVFFILVSGPEKVINKDALMKDTLDYLQKTEGISEIKFHPDKNRICFYYTHYSEKEKKKHPDYQRIVLFAGLKLSNRLPDEKIRIELIDNKSGKPDLILEFREGKVSERIK